MADPRLRQITIKQNIVKRLTKEKSVYEKEVITEKNRLERFKKEGADSHVLNKQEEVIEECLMIIPDCHRRLTKEYEELSKLLINEEDLKESKEYQSAEVILSEAKAINLTYFNQFNINTDMKSISQQQQQKIRHISELKSNVKAVIESIHLLEKNGTSPDLIDQIEAILNKLESQPQVIKSIVSKRRRQRAKRKLKMSNKKNSKFINPNSKLSESILTFEPLHSKTTIFSRPTIKTQKVHEDAKRYLEVFDLLENLYELRNGNVKNCANFSAKLDILRSIWKKVEKANIVSFQSEEEKIAEQWNEIIFGYDYKDNIVKKSKKIAMKEFLSNRRIWDTYLVTNKNFGTTIPIGWVFPKQDASDEWIEYRNT